MSSRLASIVATLALVAAIGTLYLGRALLAHSPLAIAAQAAAVALMLWARWTFGRRSFHAAANPTAGGLVTAGPYRYWRHPIYAAVLLFVWAGTVDRLLARAGGAAAAAAPVRLTTTGIVALAAVATLATVVRIRAEERLLRATYPEYERYAASTKRLVPFLF
ncbi:MAG TPA: hypothetical protein VKA84_26885 [Gemmatimonadaceae bacterium]|nr:hypothetical protein [Gemmatimonadaceae bacterium]